MNRITILIILLASACGGPRYSETWKAGAATDEHREWLLACIEKGNPMSDEEGEDLVEQCEWTANRLFTPALRRVCESRGNGEAWHEIPCAEMPEQDGGGG